MLNHFSSHLFEAESLSAKLDMIVEPFTHLALLVLDRRELPCLLLYNISEAAQSETHRMHPHTAQCSDFSTCGRYPTITYFVVHRTFDDMSILDKFAKGALVIEATWTVFQRVQKRDGERVIDLYREFIVHEQVPPEVVPGLVPLLFCSQYHYRMRNGQVAESAGAR